MTPETLAALTLEQHAVPVHTPTPQEWWGATAFVLGIVLICVKIWSDAE